MYYQVMLEVGCTNLNHIKHYKSHLLKEKPSQSELDLYAKRIIKEVNEEDGLYELSEDISDRRIKVIELKVIDKLNS